MALERVQKILAQAGISSRRKAEELIRENRVTINGKPAKLGDKAEVGKDSIKVDGKLIFKLEAPTYIAFYKPSKVISTLSDPEGRPCIGDFFKKLKTRVYPVGRLDFASEGLVLLTNDGELVDKFQKDEQLMRIYHIKVLGHQTLEDVKRLEKPMKVERKSLTPHTARLIERLASKSMIEFTVKGSQSLEISEFFDKRRFKIDRIRRVAIGQITLHGLAPGGSRVLQKSQFLAALERPDLAERLLKDEIPDLPVREERPAPMPSGLASPIKPVGGKRERGDRERAPKRSFDDRPRERAPGADRDERPARSYPPKRAGSRPSGGKSASGPSNRRAAFGKPAARRPSR